MVEATPIMDGHLKGYFGDIKCVVSYSPDGTINVNFSDFEFSEEYIFERGPSWMS